MNIPEMATQQYKWRSRTLSNSTFFLSHHPMVVTALNLVLMIPVHVFIVHYKYVYFQENSMTCVINTVIQDVFCKLLFLFIMLF